MGLACSRCLLDVRSSRTSLAGGETGDEYGRARAQTRASSHSPCSPHIGPDSREGKRVGPRKGGSREEYPRQGQCLCQGGPLISRKDPQNPLELSRKGQQSCPLSLRVEGHLKLLRPRALPLSTGPGAPQALGCRRACRQGGMGSRQGAHLFLISSLCSSWLRPLPLPWMHRGLASRSPAESGA